LQKINHTATAPLAAIGQESRRTFKMGGNAVNRPRAADDFATIRNRLEELRREREEAQGVENEFQRDPPTHGVLTGRWPPSEISEGPGRQSGSGRG
jgi:hypothetical protein